MNRTSIPVCICIFLEFAIARGVCFQPNKWPSLMMRLSSSHGVRPSRSVPPQFPGLQCLKKDKAPCDADGRKKMLTLWHALAHRYLAKVRRNRVGNDRIFPVWKILAFRVSSHCGVDRQTGTHVSIREYHHNRHRIAQRRVGRSRSCWGNDGKTYCTCPSRLFN